MRHCFHSWFFFLPSNVTVEQVNHIFLPLFIIILPLLAPDPSIFRQISGLVEHGLIPLPLFSPSIPFFSVKVTLEQLTTSSYPYFSHLSRSCSTNRLVILCILVSPSFFHLLLLFSHWKWRWEQFITSGSSSPTNTPPSSTRKFLFLPHLLHPTLRCAFEQQVPLNYLSFVKVVQQSPVISSLVTSCFNILAASMQGPSWRSTWVLVSNLRVEQRCFESLAGMANVCL